MDRASVIELANRAEFTSFDKLSIIDFTEKLERFAALIAAAEREACAQLCEIMEQTSPRKQYRDAAIWLCVEIRARGEAGKS